MKFIRLYNILNEGVDHISLLANKLADLPRDEIERYLNIKTGGYGLHDFEKRGNFVKKYSWSIPCKEAIDAFVKYARPPVFDPLAGTGYWAKILTDRGIRVIASDIGIGPKKNSYQHEKPHTKVKVKNALKLIKDFPRYANKGIPTDIILSWVPYESNIGTTLMNYLPINSRIFWIGEGYGGCTGSDCSFNFLNENCKHLEDVDLPTFYGLHDYLSIYEKIK